MRRRDDGGSASVDFVVLAVVLLVPVAYLVMALGRVQAGCYAAAAGASAAARAYTTAPDPDSAAQRARAALDLALEDQGFTAADATATTACELPGCLVPEGAVRVEVRVDVPLPLEPTVLRSALPAAVPVQAGAVAVVGRFVETAPR